MEIGVIGCGVVGGALADWLEEKTTHVVKRYDPQKGFRDDLNYCNAFFICVPVPTKESGVQNEEILIEAIARARASNEKATIFLRSSVLPGTADRFGVVSMPEFLTERRASQDMETLPVLVGKHGETVARSIFSDRPLIVVSNEEAELAKYTHNVFGAMKVTFFNIINHVCERNGLDYENVLKAARITGFIEKTHTQVPGPDWHFGYGGTCFPKDVRAFSKFLEQTIGQSTLIGAIDWENEYYRNVYERERTYFRQPTVSPCAL